MYIDTSKNFYTNKIIKDEISLYIVTCKNMYSQ